MNFIVAAVLDNYVNAHLLLGRLQNENINCWLKDENTVTVLTNSGGIKLMVAEAQIERAMTLINEENHLQNPKHSCPRCGSENFNLVDTPRKAGSLLGTIADLVLNGNSSLPVVKKACCLDCGCEYETE